MSAKEGSTDQLESSFSETPEPAPEATSAQEPNLAAEIEKLKAENTALRSISVKVESQAPAFQAQQQMTREDLSRRAVELGFTKTDESGNVVGDVEKLEAVSKIATAAAIPAWQKVSALEQELKVEKTINSAKKDALAADPQFQKLEAHVDEYLDNVSVDDKIDPAKMKKHMEIATVYARGKMGSKAPQARTAAVQQPPTPKGEEDDGMGTDNFNKPEVWETKDGKVRMVVSPRVSQKTRAMHTRDGGGVQIDVKEEWVGPKFGPKKESE